LYGGESVPRLTISAVLLRIFGSFITRREIIRLSQSILANNMFQYDHPLVAHASVRIHSSIDITDDELLATYILGYVAGTRNQDILRILQHSSICHASDKRDHVYAFLGIVDNEYGLDVDYSKENSKESVFIQIASQIIQRRNDLHILAYIKFHDATRRKDLPSWVPDWSKKCRTSLSWNHNLSMMHTTTPAKLCFRDDGKSLEVSGVYVDEYPFDRARSKLRKHDFEIESPVVSLKGDQLWLLHGEEIAVSLRPRAPLSFQFVGVFEIDMFYDKWRPGVKFALSDQAPVRIKLV
jgi:hypothetical protein